MKKVDLYMVVTCNYVTKVGGYKAILVYRGKYKLIENTSITNTTSNRVMMHCIIDSLKLLKEPCKVTVHTKGSWGIRKIKNRDGSWKDIVSKSTINRDLAIEIRDLCINKQCELKGVLDASKIKEIFVGK